MLLLPTLVALLPFAQAADAPAPPVADETAVVDGAAVVDEPPVADAPEAGPPPGAPPGAPATRPPGSRPSRRPPPSANGGERPGPPGGKAEQSERRQSPLHPVADLQIWGTVYDMDEDVQADSTGYGDPEDDAGFKLKRGRLGLVYDDHKLSAELVAGISAPYDGLDTRNGSFTMYEANVGYHEAGFGVVGGLTGVPFSRDSMISSTQLTFQERGIAAEHIAPDRDLGVLGSFDKAGFGVKLGVFNSGGTLFGDDNAGKTMVGRVEYTHGKRDVYSMWSPKGEAKGFGLGVGGGAFLTNDVATQTLAAGGDVMLRAGGLSVLADATFSVVKPTDSTIDVPGVYSETNRTGVTGQLSYGIKDFEPAVRASYYSDDSLGSWTQIFGGLVWHGSAMGMADVVRLGAGYELRLESGTSIPNDTARLWAQFSLPSRAGKSGPPEAGQHGKGGPGGPGGQPDGNHGPKY